MAESNPQPEEIVQSQEERGEEKGLKYLDFVQVAAMQAVMCFVSVYGFAKENSGPLRPGVQAVEGAVKAVVGPVYERFHDVPVEILRFVDRKVDDAAQELDRHLPSLLKSASAHAYAAAQTTPEVARTLASEVHRSGLSGAAKAAFYRYEPAARELYGKYEPAAEQYAVAAWRSLNCLPLFPQVAQILVPTAAYWAEKYNKAVGYAAANGYAAAKYVPEIPTVRIAKVFGSSEGPEANRVEPAAE